ncbi:hypothetical protein IEQ34_007298 [Dendrobium chrysotoxum]|uniref:Transcription elongation factor Eaf N-terminal domain-containing protein n=1 Tax=Dendrobium chrysotoxum TaxID=161865 RepID=A0AAV7H7V0_DENCH|nr:hypothetical protein IEQ34_007298 [Dendrobium chrysotoxum]
MANNGGEPSSAPQPERWYGLKLGSSFKERPSSKFCTLRYEFKPASIDKNQAGMLHKTKDNRVTVEFNNNQLGKPKVTFEGTSEDYKDNDGVLFFDGKSFRLERLHRAVKRLRHVRLPGEFAAVNSATTVTNAPAVESRSPPLVKTMKSQTLNKPINHAVHLEVERIDIGDPDSSGPKPSKRTFDIHSALPNPFSTSPDTKTPEPDDNVDILDDDDGPPPKANSFGFDINLPNQTDTDDEIADVDVSDDDGDKGPNAAEALRAQVNAAEEGQQQDQEQDETSSSSGSSGTGSSGSGSGSGSSSSDSDDSDGDSATSGGDIDI